MPEENKKKTPKIVLSITGGGIKGLIVGQFLKNLEKEIGKPVYEIFDLFVGTSVGSILCGCYTHGKYTAKKTMEEIMSTENCQQIMNKSCIDYTIGLFNIYPKYSGKPKRDLINKYIHNHLNSTDKNVMYISYDVKHNKPRFFKSWIKDDIMAAKAIDASSAAPGYYPQVLINHIPHIDGALSSNYPADCAYANAINLWGEDEDIRILSMGTGKSDYHINSKQWWGLLPWVIDGNLLSMLFDGNEQTVDYKMKMFSKALNHQYLYINEDIINTSMDDVTYENIEYLKSVGDKWWKKYKNEILKLLEIK